MIMIYAHAKVQDIKGQLVPKIKWKKQTDRRTDGSDCITSLANAVGNEYPLTDDNDSVGSRGVARNLIWGRGV